MEIVSGSVFIKNMRFNAFHGVMPQERVTGGGFTVSVRVGFRPDDAVRSDDVADTLNYADIYNIVRRAMEVPSNLIEHVAGRIGREIMDALPRADEVDITLSKDNPPLGADAECAGVEIKLRR